MGLVSEIASSADSPYPLDLIELDEAIECDENFLPSWSASRKARALPRPTVDAQGELVQLGDGSGENQEQAELLWASGLHSKAQGLALCHRLARRCECLNPRCRKAFKQVFRCGLRSCRFCATENFDRLFSKYLHLDELIPAELKCRPGWGWKIVDFAFRHSGVMPTAEEVRRANRVVGRVLERALSGVRGWGAIRCGEFGFDNTNYHLHCTYFGPYVPQERLSRLFLEETDGQSFKVWIQEASRGFRSALAHALKYTQKLPASTASGLALLELALHKTRRVQTMGSFYNAKLPTEKAGSLCCDACGEFVAEVSGWVSIAELGDLPELVRPRAFVGSDLSVGDGP